MLILKKGVAALVPVVLNDATTGAPFNSVAYSSVQATIIKNDGTEVDLGALLDTDWSQKTTGAYSLRGYYLLKLPASVLDQEGILHYGVAVTGAEFYPGTVNVKANTEKDVYDRIGAPVGADLSHDIQDISGAIGGGGGFSSTDRDNLLAVKGKTDLIGTSTVASKTDVDAAAATTFTASDRANLGSIKSKTDNLPAAPAAVSDVTSARDNVNTNTNTLGTALKGTSWNSVNDTFHAIRTQLDAVKTKTDLVPADPATETTLTAMKGVGFDTATDSLHQIQLAAAGAVSGGFGPADRADLEAVKAKTDLLPADPASTSGILGNDGNVYGGGAQARTVSEVYVRVRSQVEPKTTNLPADPASNTVVNARATEIKGAGFVAGDDLHTIKSSITASNFTQADRDAINAISPAVAGVRTVADNIRSDTVAINGKTANLPTDPASNSHIDAVVGAGANAFTSADHDMLVDIKTKTDRLPADPAAQSAGFGASDRDVMSTIRSKTDLLPPDPASNTNITALSNKLGTPHASVAQDIAELADVVLATS